MIEEKSVFFALVEIDTVASVAGDIVAFIKSAVSA